MHARRPVLCCVLIFAVLVCSGVQAEEEESAQKKSNVSSEESQQESEDVGELVITGEKSEMAEPLTIVPEEEVSRLQMPNTAEGMLENEAGVYLSRQRFSGNENSRLRIRGFDESRSRILWNGRNLHGSGVYGGYYVDWDSMSLRDVENIELIRGAGPAKYGNTLGGVVDITPKKGSLKPETTLELRGGLIDEDARENLWNAGISHSGSSGPFLYRLSADHRDSDGYLRNAFSQRDLFSGSLTWLLSDYLELTVSGRYNVNESGMIIYNKPDSPFYDSDEPTSLGGFLGGPGLPFKNGPGDWGPYFAGDDSYWRDERLNLDTNLSYESKDFGFDLQTFFMDQDRLERYYSASEPGHLVFKRESVPEKENWGWRADFRNEFGESGAHTVEYGAQGTYLGYGDIDVKEFDPEYFFRPGGRLHPNLTDTEGEDTITDWEGAYVQDTWRISEVWEFQPGVRFDAFDADGPQKGHVELNEDEISPRLALTAYAWEGGHVTGRYGRAVRFPTIPEYYWWNAGFQPAGRKDLSPEDADQWELEVGHDFETGTSVLARGYYYEVNDYIRTIFGYRPSRVIYNIDKVDLRGIELEVSQQLPHNFRVWANYTLQDTEKHGDVLDMSSRLTDELVELPENQFNVGIGYQQPDGLTAKLTARYVDSRGTIRGDLTDTVFLGTPKGAHIEGMGAFVDVDLYASYPVYRGERLKEVLWEVTLDNLLDDHYEEEFGYPVPGTTLITGIKATF